jgi:hypothetical protein
MGFKITRDYTAEKGETGAKGTESIRQTGFNALFMSEEQQEQSVYRGGQIKVRLKDDDGNIYFHALVDETDFSCELLLEWGGNYAGATNLDLSMIDWERGSKGKEHPYPSKDGKWVSYMG